MGVGGGRWGHSCCTRLSATLGGLRASFQGEAARGCHRLSLGRVRRASVLRPKRPTGLILRPVYQAGSMSGAGRRAQSSCAVSPACPRSCSHLPACPGSHLHPLYPQGPAPIPPSARGPACGVVGSRLATAGPGTHTQHCPQGSELTAAQSPGPGWDPAEEGLPEGQLGVVGDFWK